MADKPQWAVDNAPDEALLASRPGHLRVALTGNVASGKTSVAKMFHDLGTKEIDFDVLSRVAVAKDTPCLRAAKQIFGIKAIGPDGELNRAYVRQMIFSDPDLKMAWESVIHPETWQLMGGLLERMEDEKAVVITVPLLYEAGLESFFSPVVVVFAAPSVQMRRLVARNPELSTAEAKAIIDSQLPAREKINQAAYAINNTGYLSDTRHQVSVLWNKLNGAE